MHEHYRYAVTVQTDDKGVLYCLRSVAKLCQRTGNNQIPWGGTKDKDWRRAGNRATFRFDRPEYRDGFLAEARRLLPADSWSVDSQSDNDPAASRAR